MRVWYMSELRLIPCPSRRLCTRWTWNFFISMISCVSSFPAALAPGLFPSRPSSPCRTTTTLEAGRQADLAVASTILGTGFNFPRASTTVHLGGAYNLIEYAQQAGRAGREGGDSIALTLIDPKKRNLCANPITAKKSGMQELEFEQLAWRDFVLKKDCRRRVLAQYLVNDLKPTCTENELDCDGYSAHDQPESIIVEPLELPQVGTSESSSDFWERPDTNLQTSRETVPTRKTPGYIFQALCKNNLPPAARSSSRHVLDGYGTRKSSISRTRSGSFYSGSKGSIPNAVALNPVVDLEELFRQQSLPRHGCGRTENEGGKSGERTAVKIHRTAYGAKTRFWRCRMSEWIEIGLVPLQKASSACSK